MFLRAALPLFGALLFAMSGVSRADDLPPRVGEMTLEACAPAAPEGWCGHIERPLDSGDATAGTIAIGFEWYPARAESPAAGTIVAIQGGPGFSTTAARQLFRSALLGATARRNLLLFDVRGTGTSEPIACPGAQSAPRLYDPTAAAACARVLGADAGRYGMVAAVDDLAALLDRLGLGRVDLYGVSYGTVFEQIFALRHPDRVRTLVLDSALAIDDDLFERGKAGWFAFQRGITAVCKRDPTCAEGRLRTDMMALTEAMKGGRAADDGADDDGAVGLSDSLMSAGYDGLAYRELAAALSAWRRGDPAALDRMVATAERSTGLGEIPPAYGSAGAYLAVSCTDMPMPFDVAADPTTRRIEAEQKIATFLAEAAALMPLNEAVRADIRDLGTFCVDWPAPPPSVVPATALSADGPYPAVPALILSGELDTVTPPALGARVADRFPLGIQLVVRNGLHGTALGPGWMRTDMSDPTAGCVARIIAHFIDSATPGAVDCLAARRGLSVIAEAPRTLDDLSPAQAASGDPSKSDLRLATAIAGTVGDAVARFGRAHDDGLRGGTMTLYTSADGYVIALENVRWVEDVSLSGSIDLDSTKGIVTGSFAVEAPGGVTGTLSVGWVERDPKPVAMVTGSLSGGPLGRRTLYARLPAP